MLHANIKNIFKKFSINYTIKRAKVLNFFLKQSKPSTLKDIKIHLGNFDRVTLFRILNLFEKKNIIHSIRIDSENTFYSICSDNCNDKGHSHDHIHFKCESCNDVSCISINEFPSINIPNYKVNNIDINVIGVCKSCSP